MSTHNNDDNKYSELASHYHNKNYFGAKCLLLFTYYSLLHYLGLGLEFKFLSFMIITPIVKFFYLKDTKVFLTSVIIDFFAATAYYKYLIHWEGLWLVVYPFLVVFWLIFTEYVQFRILAGPNESYVIKVSNNPTDFLLTPIVAATYLLVGLALPKNLPITPTNFLFFVVMYIFVDWLSGVIHYQLHTVPSLRKLHMVHHEYKKDDLNTMANFYADFWDSLLMNITNIAFSIATVVFVQNPVVLKEVVYILSSTHHKYPNNTLTSFYFFEIEVIDMITKSLRMSDFHNAHHNTVDSFFGALGLFHDEHFASVTKSMKKLAPGLFEVPKVKSP